MAIKCPLSVAGLVLALLIGCVTPERRELERRVSKIAGERDRARVALDDERGKTAVLHEQLTTEKQEHAVTRAELNLARDRVRQLQRDNEELVALLQRRDSELSESPEVPASPLPADVDRQLQALAARHTGRVWYDRGRAGVSFANDRLFESGSDEVRPAAQVGLKELADIAVQLSAEDFEIIVVGHTDDVPISESAVLLRHPSNWHLSVHRAIAIKNVLVSAGLPEARLGVMGYGPCRPIGSDRALNRRVEVFFVRKGEVKPLPPVQAPSPQ